MCFEDIDLGVCEVVLRVVGDFLEEFEALLVPEEEGGREGRERGQLFVGVWRPARIDSEGFMEIPPFRMSIMP